MNQLIEDIYISRQTHRQPWIYNDQEVYSGYVFGSAELHFIRDHFKKAGMRFRTEGQTLNKASLVCSGHTKERENPDRARKSEISKRELEGKKRQRRKTVGFKLTKDKDCRHRLTLIFDVMHNSWKADKFRLPA